VPLPQAAEPTVSAPTEVKAGTPTP